jgi:CIC family chloride channel protein
MVYATEAGVQKIDNDFLRAFLGGIGLAILIFIFPPMYGEGYETIKDLLMGLESELYVGDRFENLLSSNSLLILILFLIILVKPIATAITIGSGGSGGVFAPSLFMGAVTGYFFAKVVGFVWPAVDINTANFTLVAMSGVMSGVLNAPLTAIFLIAEITGGYTLFVPLMLVSALSFSTISYFEKGSIYTKKLVESGELVTTDKDRLVLNQINIKKMIEKDLLIIHPDAKLVELVSLVKKSRRNIFPVVDENEHLMGIVTLDDIRDKMFDKEYQENVVVKSIMHKPPGFVSSNEKMQSVMNKFQLTQAWNLPVIDDGKYVGFVSKSRIFNAYRMKLIRQSKE